MTIEDFRKPGTILPYIPSGTEYRCEQWSDVFKNDNLFDSKDNNISFGSRIYEWEEYILADTPNPYVKDNHYMFKISDIERLAKEQGMITKLTKFKVGDRVRCICADTPKRSKGWELGKEFVVDKIDTWMDDSVYWPKKGPGVWGVSLELVVKKELPKSFACENTNPELWKKYISWLNKTYGKCFDGNSTGWPYYGYYGIDDSGECDYHNTKDKFDTILSLEEWDEIVNGKTETMKKELPKSFACKNTDAKLWQKYIAWLNEEKEGNFSGDMNAYYGLNFGGKPDYSSFAFANILTLEEWDEIVNKQQKTETKPKVMNKTIKKSELKKIHDVACSTWKCKIEKLAARNVFGDTIELTQSEIDEMFKAANSVQTKVLEDVFGKQLHDLDFQSSTIDFKVDRLDVFGNSNQGTSAAFIGLPPGPGVKSTFFLNPNYEWTLEGVCLKVKRK